MPPTCIKKQKTFGHRRHISKPRSSLGTEKEKRQSSLTQLDFVSTPRTNDVISIPSDGDEDEDEDFAVEQPRKRRRVSAKNSEGDDWTPSTNTKRSSVKRQSVKTKKKDSLERGQQTMTQIDFVPSAQKHHIMDDIEDDDDFGLGNEQHVATRQEGSRRTLPWQNHTDDETDHVPQSPVRNLRRKGPDKTGLLQPNLALHSIATRDFTTPKKLARHLEIPSSQSPPSIKLSSKRSQRSQRHVLGQKSPSRSPSKSPSKLSNMWRSPLKEKSANIAPPRWQPETQESQNPTMKMLQQVRLRTKMGGAPLHEEAPMPPPRRPHRLASPVKSQSGDSLATKQPSPRKLKRTTTVQDSQASDENIMTQAPPLGLRRTLTVQDSQHEDLDMSSQLYRSLSSRESLQITDSQTNNDDYKDNENDEEEEEEDDYPHTFDPVSAALDRDAARYAWTQTQAPRTQHPRTQIADSEDETDEDDLDRGIVPDSDSEDEIILLPNRAEQKGPSQELWSDDLAAPPSPQPEHQPDEPTLQPQPANLNKPSSSPPSSPPPLRPSQVSTIMPTQSSSHHSHPNHNPTPQQAQATEEAESFSPPTSPAHQQQQRPIKKPQYHDTQALTISSSPLPLPPWSSSGEVDLGLYSLPKGEGKEDAGNELASLVDFSLPPPPPLGMSSSPWR